MHPQVLQAVVGKHREERAKITETVVQQFTAERPMTAYIEAFPQRLVQEQVVKKGKVKNKQ